MPSGASPSKAEQLLQQLRDTYVLELPSRIDAIENAILNLRETEDFEAQFQDLYRDVHSMKGTAGTHGLQVFTPILHLLEDLLSSRLARATHIEAENLELALACVDLLREARVCVAANESDFAAIEMRIQALGRRLSAGALRVLLVDNSRTSRRLCVQVLDALNAEVTTASDGYAALARLLHEPFDLLVTGSEIGTLSGDALIAALRLSRSINRDIRTILLTSRHGAPTVETEPDHVIARDAGLVQNLSDYVGRLQPVAAAASD